MEASSNQGYKPIRTGSQLLYSLCEFGANPIYTISLSFLTFFYTDVLGLNAALVGVVILISKIFDGISDIWAGNVIDHTHTRNGSARPWLLRSAIPLAISYIVLFTVPNCGAVGKLIYVFVSYNFAITFAFTINNAAVSALPLYMTNDTKSRSSAYAVRLIVAGLVQLVLSMIFLNVIDAFGGDQAAWIKFAAILATISLLSCGAAYLGTKESNVSVEKARDNVPLRTAIVTVLRNKYWLMALAVTFLIVLHQVATLTVGVYYAKYILFDEKLAGNLILYHHAGGAVSMLLMPFLLQKGVSKRWATLVGGAVMLAGSLVAFVQGSGVPLIISLALRGFGFGIVSSTYYGMLADTVDYGEWKFGVRTQAVTTSAGTAGQKLGSGIGTAVFGVVLGAVGYDGLAATQNAASLSAINVIFNIFPIALYVLIIVIMLFYKLDDEYPAIQRELDARRAASMQAK